MLFESKLIYCNYRIFLYGDVKEILIIIAINVNENRENILILPLYLEIRIRAVGLYFLHYSIIQQYRGRPNRVSRGHRAVSTDEVPGRLDRVSRGSGARARPVLSELEHGRSFGRGLTVSLEVTAP